MLCHSAGPSQRMVTFSSSVPQQIAWPDSFRERGTQNVLTPGGVTLRTQHGVLTLMKERPSACRQNKERDLTRKDQTLARLRADGAGYRTKATSPDHRARVCLLTDNE